MKLATLAIFAAAYVLIAVRRLPILPIGRTFGALSGAVLLVLVGCLSPAEALAAVDLSTLGILFGMMVLQVELDRCGLLDALASGISRRVRSPGLLLAAVLVGSGLLSALLVNDAVCLLATPLVARLCRDGRLPPVPFLLAVAVGSNVGGTMTPVGTPQCVLIEGFSGIGYLGFTTVMAPIGLLLLAVAAAAFALGFRRTLRGRVVVPIAPRAPVDRRRARVFLCALGAVVAGFLAGLPLAFTALGGACLVAILGRREPREAMAGVDGGLLVFFAALFVLVGGVAKAGWISDATSAISPWLGADPAERPVRFAAFSLVASNLFSNVPFVLVLGSGYPDASTAFWLQLAATSTLAGNLTLIGSVANLIVAEQAHREGVEVGFFDFLKLGIPITILTTAVSLAALAAFGLA